MFAWVTPARARMSSILLVQLQKSKYYGQMAVSPCTPDHGRKVNTSPLHQNEISKCPQVQRENKNQMRTNKATRLWISCALVCLWGCGQEGINSPIPDFKVPDNIDPISRNVIAEKYDALQQDSHSEDAWKMFAGACLANEIFS